MKKNIFLLFLIISCSENKIEKPSVEKTKEVLSQEIVNYSEPDMSKMIPIPNGYIDPDKKTKTQFIGEFKNETSLDIKLVLSHEFIDYGTFQNDQFAGYRVSIKNKGLDTAYNLQYVKPSFFSIESDECSGKNLEPESFCSVRVVFHSKDLQKGIYKEEIEFFEEFRKSSARMKVSAKVDIVDFTVLDPSVSFLGKNKFKIKVVNRGPGVVEQVLFNLEKDSYLVENGCHTYFLAKGQYCSFIVTSKEGSELTVFPKNFKNSTVKLILGKNGSQNIALKEHSQETVSLNAMHDKPLIPTFNAPNLAIEETRLAKEKQRREEESRLAKEKQHREEQERLAKEQKLREEESRLAKEKQLREEETRLSKEKQLREEETRLAKEKQRREEESRLAKEKQLREEESRLAKEKQLSEEETRLAKEKQLREEESRLAKEKQLSEEQERLAKEKQLREEETRLAKEKQLREEEKEKIDNVKLELSQRLKAEQEANNKLGIDRENVESSKGSGNNSEKSKSIALNIGGDSGIRNNRIDVGYYSGNANYGLFQRILPKKVELLPIESDPMENKKEEKTTEISNLDKKEKFLSNKNPTDLEKEISFEIKSESITDGCEFKGLITYAKCLFGSVKILMKDLIESKSKLTVGSEGLISNEIEIKKYIIQQVSSYIIPSNQQIKNQNLYKGDYYFQAKMLENQNKLFKISGKNIYQVSNLNEGKDDAPWKLVNHKKEMYFSGLNENGHSKLFKTDGNKIVQLSNIFPNDNDYLSPILEYNNELYLEGINPQGFLKIFKTDGSKIVQVSDTYPSGSDTPSDFTIFNGSLFFRANNEKGFSKLFKLEKNSLFQISNINNDFHDAPEFLTEFNGELYFVAYAKNIGNKIFKTDGNKIVQVINTSNENDEPSDLKVFKNELYFIAQNEKGFRKLFKTNGKEVSQVSNIRENSSDFALDYRTKKAFLTDYKDELFFVAKNNNNAFKVFKTDGDEISQISNINEKHPEYNPTGSDFPFNLIVHDDELFFSAYSNNVGLKMFKLVKKEND